MFNDKTSVDQHVAEVTLTYTEHEINLSSYYIARNYYNVGDYETARKYVLRYLKVQEASADAYKLLGQIFDACDQKEAAAAKAKYSLGMDADPSSGISGALFHSRLLRHYIDNKELEMGYKHAVDVEENYDFKDNLQWTETVCRLLEMCKIMHSFDWKFWILYSSCLERLTKFFLKNGVDKPLPRFRPLIAEDTVIRNGWRETISTRLYCVTCTKEYDGKSMEEVRLEYYVAGRKAQTQGLSSPLFSFGATDRSTAPRFHALIKPSSAGLTAKATGRGFNFTPSTSSSQPFVQPIRPLLFGGAAQSSNLGFAGTIQTPFKGFCANNTSAPNSLGGLQPNESSAALDQNSDCVKSVKETGFSFGSPKFIGFGVSTAPKFGTKSLLFDQTNTSKAFGNASTISNSTGAFELGNESWGNDGTTGTGVESLGGRMGVNSAVQDTGTNQVDQLVLDELRILSESKKTLLKNIRTWQERVTSLKETVKHKCELLSTVEAELLDGVELYNVSTREVDDRPSTDETKTVATNAISVKAQQKEDSPKPKAGDMFGLAGKLKTRDDANFNMSFGQAKAGSLTSNPIIQEKKSNDSAKAAQKSNETSKPRLFAGFSFTKPDSTSENAQTKNANTRVPAATINAVGVQPAPQKTDVNKQKSLAEMFKPAVGSWECKSCYTRNDATNVQCLACETPAPNAKPAVVQPAKNDAAQNKSLAEMFKSAADSWECGSCYTRNNGANAKCLACESPSPNAPQSVVTHSTAAAPHNGTHPTAIQAKFSTGKTPLSQLFKPATGSWECKGCYIVNSGSNSYCVACDAPKDPSMPAKPKAGGFKIASLFASSPSFSFGIPASAPKDRASSFSFGLTKSDTQAAGNSAKLSSLTFGSPNLNSGATFSLGTPQNLELSQNPAKPYAGLVLGSSGQSFSFQIPAKPTLKTPGGGKKSKQEVVESVDTYFAPVVPLPDKVDVKTGEENEEILYSHRAKLFRYESKDKEWKERGLGEIKLLKHRESGKLRLLMRRDQVLKLCLNHIITPDMKFTPKDDRTWLWYAADYSMGDISHETFACRFRTDEIAQGFEKAIHNARELTKARADKATSSSSSDIEIVYLARVTSEEKAAALKLKLPGNFYAYKKRPDCPGCIGCKDNTESSLISETAEVPTTLPSAPSIPLSEMSKADQEFAEKSRAFEGLSPPPFGAPASIQPNPVVLESVDKVSSETKKEGGFSFLSPENAASFSTLAANAPHQPAFQTDPNFSFAGAGATVFGAKQAEDGEPDNGEEHDPHFEPIVPLPDAIEVRTGEEDEEKVFGQ